MIDTCDIRSYAGYHDGPDKQRFIVFRIGYGWYWMCVALRIQYGPFPDSLTAYRSAVGDISREA